MRAAKLTAAGRIEVCEEKKPEILTPDEVLVRVKAVGICGTDLHIFKGERADVTFPRVMGHELSGVVEETAEAVSRIRPGDRVTLDPVFSCGVCKTCLGGHENICPDVKCFGVQMDGGFQDYIVVAEKHLHPFSEKISFEQAALAEPFSVGANVVTRAQVSKDDKVVILGSGTIGLCILQAAKTRGAKAMVTDVEQAKLEKAAEAGADLCVNSRTESLEQAMQTFAPEGASVVVDAVGIASLTGQALDLTAPGARVVVIGFDDAPAEIPPAKITRKELTLLGSRMNCHQFPKVMQWLEEGRVNADLMITGMYPLEQIQTAFESALENGRKNIKTLIQL